MNGFKKVEMEDTFKEKELRGQPVQRLCNNLKVKRGQLLVFSHKIATGCYRILQGLIIAKWLEKKSETKSCRSNTKLLCFLLGLLDMTT